MATAYESITECRICFREYSLTVRPMILPCHHSFCLECVNRLRRGNTIQCPNDKIISDFGRVIPDFRFEEFKQALKETEEEFAKAISGGQNEIPRDRIKCEWCDERPIYSRCEDCEQLICSYCQMIHLKAKATKTHRINTLDKKDKEFKDAFQKELNSVRGKMDLFTKCIKQLSIEKNDTENMKNITIATSREFRKICLLDVNNRFDHLDAQILSIAQRHLTQIEEYTKSLECKLQNLEFKFKEMDSVLKKNEKELALKGKDCYQKCKSLLASIESPSINIVKMGISIHRPQEWNPELAGVLESHYGDITLNYNIGHTDCQSTKLLPAQRNQSNSTVGPTLALITSKKWRLEKEVSLPGFPGGLRVINKYLWQCHSAGITIYDTELSKTRDIPSGRMACVYDVASFMNKCVIIAAHGGLYHASENGEILGKMGSAPHFSLAVHARRLYAVRHDKEACLCSIRVYEQRSGSWQLRHGNTIQCKDNYVTIAVNDSHMVACLLYSHRIDVYSHSGQLLFTLETHGNGDAPGTFYYPRMCCMDAQDHVLIADYSKERFQVVDDNKEWSIVDMDREVSSVCSLL